MYDILYQFLFLSDAFAMASYPSAFWQFLSRWFAYPLLLSLVLLFPLLWSLAWLAQRRRQKQLARLGSWFVLRTATSLSVFPRRVRGVCLAFGFLLLVVGMAGPRWGYVVDYRTATGRDIVVVLDASRSMLAEAPSRNKRARDMLLKLCAWAELRGGHRLGLVVFAGEAKVICPLTRDYGHFRFVVREQHPLSLPPALRPKSETGLSGTRIGKGLKVAAELHDVRFQGSQDILLVSDGDDPSRNEEWRLGIKAARRAGIAVDIVGVGDPKALKWIPLETGFLKFEGKEVETRLEEKPLREIAGQTQGVYIPARTRTLPLGELYQEILDQRKFTRKEDDGVLPIRQMQYGWFLAPALVLLMMTVLIKDGRSLKRARLRSS